MQSVEKLRMYLERFCPLPATDWELLSSNLQYRVFRRRELVLKAGQMENYVSFIEHGIIRYYVEEEDKDITFEIAFENSLAAGYDSFLTRTPVLYNAEALVDTALWSIDYDSLQKLYDLSKTGERLGRLAGEQLYIRKNKRQMSLLKDTAEQRYKLLLSDYSHFVQQVPLKYLASYIGITPQALSRIRRRTAKDRGRTD